MNHAATPIKITTKFVQAVRIPCMKTNLAALLACAFLGLAAHPVIAQQPENQPNDSTPAADKSARFGDVEFRQWHRGEPPVKLIPKDDGFCALTSVAGRFAGSGEQVGVYIGADDYWYLGGKSDQEGVSASCMIVRYPAALKPEPTPVKILAATYSFGSQYADVTARVRALLQKGDEVFQANPWWLQADPQPGWNKALVIFCEVRGKRAVFSVGEGENVSRGLILKDARVLSDGADAKVATKVD